MLRRLLFDELGKAIGGVDEFNLDATRWGNVFHSGFDEHFQTARHIKRYANGLRVTLPLVAGEVDLIDFLALELLRVFHPEVYAEMRALKEFLAPQPILYGGREQDREGLRSAFDSLTAKASGQHRDAVRSLLREIFPALERIERSVTWAGEIVAPKPMVASGLFPAFPMSSFVGAIGTAMTLFGRRSSRALRATMSL